MNEDELFHIALYDILAFSDIDMIFLLLLIYPIYWTTVSLQLEVQVCIFFFLLSNGI